MILATESGMLAYERGSSGSLRSRAVATAIGVVPLNGALPVSISNRSKPSA